MNAMPSITFMKNVAEVERKLDLLAFDLELTDPETGAQVRAIYRELVDASDTFAFGRPLHRMVA